MVQPEEAVEGAVEGAEEGGVATAHNSKCHRNINPPMQTLILRRIRQCSLIRANMGSPIRACNLPSPRAHKTDHTILVCSFRTTRVVIMGRMQVIFNLHSNTTRTRPRLAVGLRPQGGTRPSTAGVTVHALVPDTIVWNQNLVITHKQYSKTGAEGATTSVSDRLQRLVMNYQK